MPNPSQIKGALAGDYPETLTEHSSLCFCWAQMAQGKAEGPRHELVTKIRGMYTQRWGYLGRRAPWPLTVHPNGGNFTPLKGMACKCTHSLLAWLHLIHLMYEWRRTGVGGGWCDVAEKRQAISVCPLKLVLWLFPVMCFSPGTLRESGRGRHPYSQNPKVSSSIQSRTQSQYNLWHLTPPAKVKIYVVCGRNKYGVCLLLGTGAGQTKHDTKEKQNSSTQWILQAPKRLYWWNILVQDDFREQTSSTDTFNFYLFICCRNSADREITKPSYTSAKCMFSWWLLLLCWPSWKCYFSFFSVFLLDSRWKLN